MPATSEDRSPSESKRTEVILEALLNYIVESDKRPVYYAYETSPGVPRQTGQFAPQTVPIENGRAFVDELSLDQQGFELVNHKTAVRDFYDREEVQQVYYPESLTRN
jgi:hypothetical protein